MAYLLKLGRTSNAIGMLPVKVLLSSRIIVVFTTFEKDSDKGPEKEFLLSSRIVRSIRSKRLSGSGPLRPELIRRRFCKLERLMIFPDRIPSKVLLLKRRFRNSPKLYSSTGIVSLNLLLSRYKIPVSKVS